MRNSDGYVTDAKKKAMLELSSDLMAELPMKDCPAHAGKTSEEAKTELKRHLGIYQRRLYALLTLMFASRSYLWRGIHGIEDKDCGEQLLRALLKWGGAEGFTNQMIMEKALKIVAKVKVARNIKALDAAVQEMLELINYIPPDQRAGIDKLFSAVVLTVMETSEVPSLLVQSDKPLPALDLMPRGETAEWFSRIREILDRNAPASHDDFPAFAKIARANAALAQPWSRATPVQPDPYHSNGKSKRFDGKGNDGLYECRYCNSKVADIIPHLAVCGKNPRNKAAGGGGGVPRGGGGDRRDKTFHKALRAAVADKQRYFKHDGVFHNSSDGKHVGSEAGTAENESDSEYPGCLSPARACTAKPASPLATHAARRTARRENCIDSGATQRMAHNSQASSPLAATSTCIITATGARTGPASKGELAVRCRTTSGEQHTLRVPNTLFSPEIDVTITSLRPRWRRAATPSTFWGWQVPRRRRRKRRGRSLRHRGRSPGRALKTTRWWQGGTPRWLTARRASS